ncbi:MAG: stage III sporulation protein AG [Oscillospiraceae bacterium]|nr:stage III sporulation protein AG [Oscillospiraceae bacterium]
MRKLWDKYKFAALVALIGAGLLLWPSGSGGTRKTADVLQAETAESRDIQAEMEEILGTISGVGQVKVMLTVDTDGERQLAQDTELTYSGDTQAPEDYSRRSETVLVGSGSGGGTVVTRTVYPTYRGALVVCQGGDRAEVKLAVTEAVAALTGLSADRITVAKWQ